MAEKIVLPRLFLTMEEGLITKWYKSMGEPVSTGDILFSVEAEKASLDIESPISGILAKIYVSEGESIQVGAEVALIAGANEPIDDLNVGLSINTKQEDISSNPCDVDLAEVRIKPLDVPIPSEQINQVLSHARIMPKVRRMALDMGIDINDLSKAFPGKSITEKEIQEFNSKRFDFRK
jgi:pyruvate dehydrogenase E2 component (dihydrolipoamide acetyltransferase)